MRHSPTPQGKISLRCGYTLIELLVVIAIIVIILSMTLASVNYVRSGDKVSSAANQIKSVLSGARDRAIFAGEPRGVRFFVEQNLGGSASASRTVTTMAFIAPGGTWAAPKDSAKIQLERIDGNIDGKYDHASDLLTIVRGFNNPGWWNLKRRGLLVDGMRIRIPSGPTGNWYPITTGTAVTNPSLDVTQPPLDEQVLLLQIPFADGGNAGQKVAFTNLTYELELPTRLLPQDPAILPDGVVIDLDGCRIPNTWRPSVNTGGVYSGYMDVVFSPRGAVIGDAAAAGIIHLYVCDVEDALFLKEQWIAANSLSAFSALISAGNPFIPMDTIAPLAPNQSWVGTEQPYHVKDRRVVTIFTQTGSISSHPVNTFVGADGTIASADLNSVGIADDPYLFAETGGVAK